MKKTITALAAALALPLLPSLALADVGFNVGAVTDYRFRGISQSRLKPALQGGVDYTRDGFYAGAWASTIKWIKDGGGDAAAELDLYAGYGGEFRPGFGYDVGVLRYQYPNNSLAPSANTTEAYGAVKFSAYTLKYSHSVTDLFGFADSKNSGYLDFSATLAFGDGWTLTPHVGHQRVRRNGKFSYTDYALTVGKQFWGVDFSLALIGTDTDEYIGASNKDLGKATVVLGAKTTF